jgi:hypothetical protein
MANQPPLRRRLALLILRLYPRAWRRRYEQEQAGLVTDAAPRWSTVADLSRGALRERLDPALTDAAGGLTMAQKVRRFVFSFGISCALACAASVAVTLAMLTGPPAVGAMLHPEIPELGLYYRLYLGTFFTFQAEDLLLAVCLGTGILFLYSLVFTAPVAMALVLTRAGQAWPLISRLVWVLSFVWFDVWLLGIQIERMTGLAVGAWVLARTLFPRLAAQPSPMRPVTNL